MKTFKSFPETDCPRANALVVEPFCVGDFLFMEAEVWKDITGYECHYKISNYGNVKSIKKGKEFILCKSVGTSGYRINSLCINSNVKTLMIHRLVAETFIGNSNGMQVNHIDGNKLNNNVSNLEYVSGRENIQKYYFTTINKTKRLGATYNKATKKWRSFIRVNGKQIYLGFYETELEASNVYNEAVKKYDYGTNS
jgi:hypothetical protein